MSCEPSCPDCGAVDCDRSQSSNQQCSPSFHPGFQKVCNTCRRMECNCAAETDRERHNIWVEEMRCERGILRRVDFALGAAVVELVEYFDYLAGRVYRVRDVATGHEDVVGVEFLKAEHTSSVPPLRIRNYPLDRTLPRQ